MESILLSIKKMLGITEEYTHFDSDIVMHTNTVFVILNQLGVGPSDGFYIMDENAIWSSFTEDDTKLEIIKTYMFLRVRLLFDPPASSVVVETMNRAINELEWRLYVAADNESYDDTEVIL